jgi:hypothetical protein
MFSFQGNQIVVKEGEIPLSDCLKFLSDATAMPLITWDLPGPSSEKVRNKAEMRLELKKPSSAPTAQEEKTGVIERPSLEVADPGPFMTVLREGGFDVQRVVLPSGRVVLEVRKIPPTNGEVDAPVMIKAPEAAIDSPRPNEKPSLEMMEGAISLHAILSMLSQLAGEDVIYERGSGPRLEASARPFLPRKPGPGDLFIPADVNGVDEEFLREFLEGQGFRVRQILGNDGKRQIHVSPRVDRGVGTPQARKSALKAGEKK